MLGAMLFNALINDLKERLACNVIRFADEVKLRRNPSKDSPVYTSFRAA